MFSGTYPIPRSFRIAAASGKEGIHAGPFGTAAPNAAANGRRTNDIPGILFLFMAVYP